MEHLLRGKMSMYQRILLQTQAGRERIIYNMRGQERRFHTTLDTGYKVIMFLVD